MTKDERDQQVVQSYLDGQSGPAVARSFQISEALVRKILAAKGVKATHRSSTASSDNMNKTLSRTHEKLGERLAFSRSMEIRQTRQEAALKIGWTTHKLAAIEKGVFNVTLNDLLDISTYTNKGIAELVAL
ncbi:hypothetical protein PJWF_00066 [Achromobacter phage JWF]|uniref:hypothetical protein n=1 Tax=Achromobacter phage JWF TaxID=1589748 RepID=UPI000588E850|nr:hypothetical protein AXJ13_gp066 [Achromobacter phage JWF]AJD82960.1 hypothetical protein PJWF_00066 [Achromobacter phage JWF]